ncbi:MAG: winged helix-turn-helix domain-containing protein [Bacteroidaceae bacterium]|jgi:hypothetical protein
MDVNQIGTDAGIVWLALDETQALSYAELKEKSGLSDRALNAAIGWLAREKKIEIGKEPNTGEELYYHPFHNYFY